MITQRDATTVLDTLSAAYPTHPMPPESVDLYLDALSTQPFTDFAVLMAAVVAHVRSEDWHPTVHQLIVMYQAEARARMQERADAEADRIMAAGQLPGVVADVGYAVEMVDVMRTALTQIGRGGTATDMAAVAERLAGERGLIPPPGVQTYVCPHCRDLGYVAELTEPFTVRPCGACQPELHQRWADGHLAPGHTCADCRARP